MARTEDGYELLLGELGRINSELAAQRRLSAEVAHDLAVPAQVVLGLSEMLLDHAELNDDLRHRVEQIERTARTMASLVDELRRGLDLGVDPTLNIERHDVEAFVTSVVERSRLLSSTKRISLVVDSTLEATAWVEIDGPRLERALTNLLGNAIKFSPVQSTITVSLAPDGTRVAIGVADQGPGISPEGQKRIFEVFHREAHTSHLPGLGLGLHIARQIAQSHGGELDVESQLGAGATFRLRIPTIEQPALTSASMPVQADRSSVRKN